MGIQTFYSIKDLLCLGISDIPTAADKVRDKANRENWESRKRVGRGGGLEYALSSMPSEIQNAIRDHHLSALVLAPRKNIVAASQELTIHESKRLESLTQSQRDISNARMALVGFVLELEKLTTRFNAVKTVIEQAKNRTLHAHLQACVQTANARNGSNSRTLSQRSLMGWVLSVIKLKSPAERLQALAPIIRTKTPVESLSWMPTFLSFYQKTNGVSVIEAHADFKKACATANIAYPSIHQVRRGLEKMSMLEKTQNRITGSIRKAMLPYVKRDWDILGANAVWIGDGTAMKLKVAHPDHGRPFIPELTMIIDGGNRMIVGWSVSLAENVLAVADAFRNGVEKHGLPLIYYSDNGAGQTGKLLDDDMTGIFARLGVEHQTGIAGNPQGRGIIERVNKTIAQRIARQFPTYFGGDSDREATRKMLVGVNAVANAKKQCKDLTEKQAASAKKYPLPSWQQFIDMCREVISWYNNEHEHREIGTTPFLAREAQLLNTEIDMLEPEDIRDMFRPQVLRKVQRGWVSLFNNDYFSNDLADFDGFDVRVSFDIHNPESVIIRDNAGAYMCGAKFNGNKRAAFPQFYVDKVRDDRRANRLRLAKAKMNEIEAEHRGTIEHQPDLSSLLLSAKPTTNNIDLDAVYVSISETKQNEKPPIFLFPSEKEAYEKSINEIKKQA